MAMASPPDISILLPMWNAAATLPACLRSIQRQHARHWQCIMVDDGSQDTSKTLAQDIVARDPRFKLIATPHRGLIHALNTGLAACEGRYIARMDADDLMHQRRLDWQARALDADPNLTAVGCQVRLFPRRHLRDGRLAYERWLNQIETPSQVCAEAFVECPIAHPTLMIRRETLTRFGYRDQGWPEDYDLILRLLAAEHTLRIIPRRLLSWRDHSHRLSRRHERYALARFTDCKAAFLASTFLAHHSRYILWGFGETGKALRRALAQHDKHPAYIVELHPGRLGKIIHHAPVIPPEALPQTPRQPVIISVAGQRPRDEIRAEMKRMGFEECRDFVCAA